MDDGLAFAFLKEPFVACDVEGLGLAEEDTFPARFTLDADEEGMGIGSLFFTVPDSLLLAEVFDCIVELLRLDRWLALLALLPLSKEKCSALKLLNYTILVV